MKLRLTKIGSLSYICLHEIMQNFHQNCFSHCRVRIVSEFLVFGFHCANCDTKIGTSGGHLSVYSSERADLRTKLLCPQGAQRRLWLLHSCARTHTHIHMHVYEYRKLCAYIQTHIDDARTVGDKDCLFRTFFVADTQPVVPSELAFFDAHAYCTFDAAGWNAIAAHTRTLGCGCRFEACAFTH